MSKIQLSNKWATEVLKALGLDPSLNRRLIIDCQVGEPIKIYLENFGDERLWDVRMPPLEVVEVVGHAPRVDENLVIEAADVTGMADVFRKYQAGGGD